MGVGIVGKAAGAVLHRDVRRESDAVVVVVARKDRRGRRERRRGPALLLVVVVVVVRIRRYLMNTSDTGNNVVRVHTGELRHHRMVTRRNGAVTQVVYRIRVLSEKMDGWRLNE